MSPFSLTLTCPVSFRKVPQGDNTHYRKLVPPTWPWLPSLYLQPSTWLHLLVFQSNHTSTGTNRSNSKVTHYPKLKLSSCVLSPRLYMMANRNLTTTIIPNTSFSLTHQSQTVPEVCLVFLLRSSQIYALCSSHANHCLSLDFDNSSSGCLFLNLPLSTTHNDKRVIFLTQKSDYIFPLT